MIELIDGLPDGVVGLEAVGKVESADYEAIAAPAVKHALERHPKIRLIHVLDDRFTGYTPQGAHGRTRWSKPPCGRCLTMRLTSRSGMGLATFSASRSGRARDLDGYRGLRTNLVPLPRLGENRRGRACGLCNVSDLFSPRRRVATVAKALRESPWETLHARPHWGQWPYVRCGFRCKSR